VQVHYVIDPSYNQHLPFSNNCPLSNEHSPLSVVVVVVVVVDNRVVFN